VIPNVLKDCSASFLQGPAAPTRRYVRNHWPTETVVFQQMWICKNDTLRSYIWISKDFSAFVMLRTTCTATQCHASKSVVSFTMYVENSVCVRARACVRACLPACLPALCLACVMMLAAVDTVPQYLWKGMHTQTKTEHIITHPMTVWLKLNQMLNIKSRKLFYGCSSCTFRYVCDVNVVILGSVPWTSKGVPKLAALTADAEQEKRTESKDWIVRKTRQGQPSQCGSCWSKCLLELK